MNNLARKLDNDALSHEIGRVTGLREGGRFGVVTEGGEYRAKRAVSCLLEPEVGDTVALLTTQAGACYVTAVLEREAEVTNRIVVEGDLEVQLSTGKLTFAAQEGVNLLAAKEVSISAGALRVNAREGNLILERIALLGGFATAELEKIKVVAGSLDQVLDRFSQRVKRSFRKVEELDQVKAEHIDYAAASSMSLHAQNALVTAEELVKVDGEQIHVG
jgi:F0F1-type ATP synthase epsilon subunit